MAEKIHAAYRLPEDVHQIIETTRKEQGLSTKTDAVVHMIRDYDRRQKQVISDDDMRRMANMVCSSIDAMYQGKQERILRAASGGEHYAFLILDAINTLLYDANAAFLIPAFGEMQHKVLQESEENYRKRIERNKQIKDDRRRRGGK